MSGTHKLDTLGRVPGNNKGRKTRRNLGLDRKEWENGDRKMMASKKEALRLFCVIQSGRRGANFSLKCIFT